MAPTATTTLESTAPIVPPEDDQIIADILVEEVSIDGMCGVY